MRIYNFLYGLNSSNKKKFDQIQFFKFKALKFDLLNYQTKNYHIISVNEVFHLYLVLNLPFIMRTNAIPFVNFI